LDLSYYLARACVEGAAKLVFADIEVSSEVINY